MIADADAFRDIFSVNPTNHSLLTCRNTIRNGHLILTCVVLRIPYNDKLIVRGRYVSQEPARNNSLVFILFRFTIGYAFRNLTFYFFFSVFDAIIG